MGNIKLIDFGLCCPFRPGAKITKAAGTPYSVAPELVTPPVQYDQRRLGGWVRCGAVGRDGPGGWDGVLEVVGLGYIDNVDVGLTNHPYKSGEQTMGARVV